jgi:hypothetical protein
VSDGPRDATTGTLQAKLTAARAEVNRLRDENAQLKAIIAEVQKALEAAEADLARYRDRYEEGRPNVPERVPSSDQQLALDGILESLGAELLSPGNDADNASTQDGASPVGRDSSAPTAGASPEAPAVPPKQPSKKRSDGHGRRNLLRFKLLPVDTVVLDPPEVLAVGGVGFKLVSSEKSSRIAYRPGRYIRLVVVRRTWVRVSDSPEHTDASTPFVGSAEPRANDTAPPMSGASIQLAAARDPNTEATSAPAAELLTAPIPEALWPNAFADASAVAEAVVSKYDDLLPLHRQEKISRREGFTIPRSTLCNWFTPAYAVLHGVVEAMFADAKATAPVLATDATGAPVRPASKGRCEPWHVFVFVADEAHVVFRHALTHDSDVLTKMLRGFRGKLLGDASSIYSPLVTAGTIVLACCWAHVRRYFFKALESERSRALEAIAIIGKLFEVQRACKDLPGAEKTSKRAALARPVLKLFDEWLDRERPRTDPRSPLRAAITYADNQRDELRRFLDDGRLRIDNNVCEGLLRSLVLGLNNWRYFETETGLRWYTTFRSLIASCHMHGLCPQRYLECVLRLAPHWSQQRLLELSPKYWRDTAAKLTPEQLTRVRPSWSTAFDAFAIAPQQPADDGAAQIAA